MGNIWPFRHRAKYDLTSGTVSAFDDQISGGSFVYADRNTSHAPLHLNTFRRNSIAGSTGRYDTDHFSESSTIKSSATGTSGSRDTGYFSESSTIKSSATGTSGSRDTGYFSELSTTKRSTTERRGIKDIFAGQNPMAVLSDKNYPCVCLERESCDGFDKHSRLYSLSNEENQEVTNISHWLEKGFNIMMVGQGPSQCTEATLLQIQGKKCILCLVLDYDEKDQCLTPLSKELLQLGAKWPSYWTSKAGREQDKLRHSTAVDVYTYKLLRSEFSNEEFEEYLKNVHIASIVKATFEKMNKIVKAYPGREQISISNDIVNVVVPLDNLIDDDVDDCLNQCRHQSISVQWAVKEEEETNICNYMFEQDAPSLSEDSKIQMHNVIDKYTDSLMRAHSNLIAIKGSAFRSKSEGTDITPEKCIVLYCTGKGIIPLLEMPFPKELDNFKVDVWEDCLSFGGMADYEEVLSMGLSIGLEGRPSGGSLGPFVEENSAHCGFLTCSHVCFELKHLQQHAHTKVEFLPSVHKILQPSSEHNNKNLPIDTIYCGSVRSSYYGDVNCGRNKVIGVDVAHVQIEKVGRIPSKAEFADSHSNEDIHLPQTGDIVRNIKETISNKWAYKCGVGTGNTRGKLDMDGETNMNTENMHGDCGGRVFTLYHQYKVFSNQKIFAPGDSGAAVYVECDGDTRLLGILVGGSRSGKHYYVSPITAVLCALGDNIAIKIFPVLNQWICQIKKRKQSVRKK